MRAIAPLSLSFALLLGGCQRVATDTALGTVEWDQVELVAESSEPILEILVRENDPVAAGAVLARLDDRRARAELARADAELARLNAMLEQQQHGARPESIAESRARLTRAQSLARNAQQDLLRVRDMRERKLSTPAELDRSIAAERAALAEQSAARAALDLLLAGTRIEELTQTEAAMAAASASRDGLMITLERLQIRAPRAGRIDAIAAEVGDQPQRGAVLMTLLVGEAPHARVFIPAPMRVGLTTGAAFSVEVEGFATPIPGTLRYVRAQASFTPYYALSGDDATRLAYVAEIDLQGEAARELPAGLPLRARRLAP